MNIEFIKPGMVFKENDNRFNRWVKIVAVVKDRLVFEVSSTSAQGPWKPRWSTSKSPRRFHNTKATFGYSIVHDFSKPTQPENYGSGRVTL